MFSLAGRVLSGQGVGHSFTQVDWVQTAFVEQLGINPYPGTLNLLVEGAEALSVWEEMQREATDGKTAVIIRSPNPEFCDAHCYPIRIAEQYVGAIVVPQIDQYPPNHIEIIASIPLRQILSLQDDDLLEITRNEPVQAAGVIFDVDGTLVDSIPAYLAIAQHGLNPFGIDVTLEQIRDALNTNNPNVWEDLVPANRPNHAESVATAVSRAVAEYPNALKQHATLLPHVATTLSTLQTLGFRLAIMTASRGYSMKLLEEAGLLDYFEVLVTGRDVEKRKPDPEGLLKVASQMNLHANSLVYVGDSLVDIEASQAAGMAAIGVLMGAGDGAALTKAGANWLLNDLSRLATVLRLV